MIELDADPCLFECVALEVSALTEGARLLREHGLAQQADVLEGMASEFAGWRSGEGVAHG